MRKAKIVMSIFFLGMAILVLHSLFSLDSDVTTSPPEDSDVLGEEDLEFESKFSASGYEVTWFESSLENIQLIPNFDEKLPSSEIISRYECVYAINGGFYDKENLPIGYFKTEESVISDYVENRLMNAVFSVNYFDIPRITRNVPRDELKLAFQTGPLLIENDTNISYFSETDKNARRMILAVTGENKALFLSVYNPKSKFDGPKLEQLTEILYEFENQTGHNIADATNLDGGSASAFYSPETSLREISPVGSIICIK